MTEEKIAEIEIATEEDLIQETFKRKKKKFPRNLNPDQNRIEKIKSTESFLPQNPDLSQEIERKPKEIEDQEVDQNKNTTILRQMSQEIFQIIQ